MTRKEFEIRVTGKLPTDEEFAVIETVYAFHPSISETDGKSQIAYIYNNFGMRVIRDMLPTAKMAENLERAIMTTKNTLVQLQDEYNELRQ